MIRPNIKDYREDRRAPRMAALTNRRHFMGRSALDIRWAEETAHVNIKKNGKIYEMEVVLPGFRKEEIEVEVRDYELIIRASNQNKDEKTKEDYVLREYNFDLVERRFQLAKGIGHEKITAKYENGILYLSFIDVPESEEEAYKHVEIA